jgi:2-dehydropantoate 2-reductase
LGYGHVHLSEFVGPARERTRRIAALLSESGINCPVVPDLRYARWEKLVWNVPFNGLGAVLDKTTDKLIATEEGRALVKGLMLEVIKIAESLGLSFPADMPDKKIQATYSMGAYKTSMQVDRQAGRPLEVGSLLHQPLKTARAKGIATPLLEMLYEMSVLPRDHVGSEIGLQRFRNFHRAILPLKILQNGRKHPTHRQAAAV